MHGFVNLCRSGIEARPAKTRKTGGSGMGRRGKIAAATIALRPVQRSRRHPRIARGPKPGIVVLAVVALTFYGAQQHFAQCPVKALVRARDDDVFGGIIGLACGEQGARHGRERSGGVGRDLWLHLYLKTARNVR